MKSPGHKSAKAVCETIAKARGKQLRHQQAPAVLRPGAFGSAQGLLHHAMADPCPRGKSWGAGDVGAASQRCSFPLSFFARCGKISLASEAPWI